MLECPLLTHAGIASAIYERPSLSSFSVGNFMEPRESKNVTSYFIDSLVSLKHLTHLDLSLSCVTDDMLISVANEDLPLRNLVLQDCCEYTYFGISYFLSKCRFVQHLNLQNAKFLNDDDNSSMLYPYLRDLVSINVSGCNMLTNVTLFAFPRHCPLLSDIRMESTSIGIGPLGEPFVYRQVKSLHLANNSQLLNVNIDIFAFMFPNLQLLDLNSCPGISKDIGNVLRRWGDIRYLELPFYPQKELPWINFKSSKLEVLNLSKS
ncbi:putative leucine-rich repeat domain, L domain-containing protein [Medicago truncatula]|uniref:Putative leucine-rich repeat domain, L domain-containing protein n=1 Tax=Medicago truncatula TaxID=3880 RepID=A0A396IW16_MEDTR|nr:putative leucine-rich repeat domain, L domain-containing protein [Medicago truncatula]